MKTSPMISKRYDQIHGKVYSHYMHNPVQVDLEDINPSTERQRNRSYMVRIVTLIISKHFVVNIVEHFGNPCIPYTELSALLDLVLNNMDFMIPLIGRTIICSIFKPCKPYMSQHVIKL